MYLGIDIGTSAVKLVLVDEQQNLLASASAGLSVQRPQPGWSEQQPGDWWQAVLDTIDELKASHAGELAATCAIGLSGQMHGATLLDKTDQPLRACMLWNDGRAQAQCAELETRSPASRAISGNIAMPGFTAPKILWVHQHEPDIFNAIHKVLLPKDYVRLCLTGEYISDMSDAAGTLWLDTGKRTWSGELLEATGLGLEHMPALVEGTEAGGQLRSELASRWGMVQPVMVAGGAGDNAASACGIGCINPGDAFISLGTSGVIFVANARFSPNTDGAVHAFCHALPDSWHQMGVILSAASCFDWLARVCNCTPDEIYAQLSTAPASGEGLLFLPYLSGERTPHNDTNLRGVFAGLDHETDRQQMSHAVAEGVAYAFHDCLSVLTDAGTRINRLLAVGGGAQSRPWLQILADVLNLPVLESVDSEAGAAFGAARLAMACHTGAQPVEVFKPATTINTFEPDTTRTGYHQQNRARLHALYPSIKETFAT